MFSISHCKDAPIFYIENMENQNFVYTLKDFLIKAVEAYW